MHRKDFIFRRHWKSFDLSMCTHHFTHLKGWKYRFESSRSDIFLLKKQVASHMEKMRVLQKAIYLCSLLPTGHHGYLSLTLLPAIFHRDKIENRRWPTRRASCLLLGKMREYLANWVIKRQNDMKNTWQTLEGSANIDWLWGPSPGVHGPLQNLRLSCRVFTKTLKFKLVFFLGRQSHCGYELFKGRMIQKWLRTSILEPGCHFLGAVPYSLNAYHMKERMETGR